MSTSSVLKKQNKTSGEDDIPPPLPTNWNRCHAYNARKRRYCRQMPIPLTSAEQCSTTNTISQPRYCGNHRHLMIDYDSISSNEQSNEAKRQRTDEKKNEKDRGKRVPCPIDPSHFIYESSIAKHVLICPAVKLQQEAKNKEYYFEGINLNGHGELSSSSSNGLEENTNDMIDMKEAKKLALAVLRVFQHVFLSSNICKNIDGSNGTPSIEQLQSITDKDIYNALEEVDLSNAEEGTTEYGTGKLTNAITKHHIGAGGPRHLHQIASILGHVRQNGMISSGTSSSSPLVIEIGAGRGMTGLVVAGALGSSLKQAGSSAKVNLCIVERAGTRGKAETRIRNTEESKYSEDDCIRLDNVDVMRVKCDMAHVDMCKAINLNPHKSESSKQVYIAKHLCGAGTDLAIKSIKSLSTPIDGCFMATCCHGLCTWSEYVGRDSFIQLFTSVGGLTSFSEKEFNLIKRWTAASVLESAEPDKDNEHKDNTTTEEEKGRYPSIFKVVSDMGLSCGGALLGRACQRLIDYGRCEYMRANIFNSSGSYNVELKHYVSRDITPQNALIVASKR